MNSGKCCEFEFMGQQLARVQQPSGYKDANEEKVVSAFVLLIRQLARCGGLVNTTVVGG